MGDLEKRLAGLEEFVNRTVTERLDAELRAILNLLEVRLTPDEFLKVARILAEAAPDEPREERS